MLLHFHVAMECLKKHDYVPCKIGLPGQHNALMCQAEGDGLDNIMLTEHSILATRKIKSIKFQL